jgi:hypothetical protein
MIDKTTANRGFSAPPWGGAGWRMYTDCPVCLSAVVRAERITDDLWNIISAFYLYSATVLGGRITEYQHNLSRQTREQKALAVMRKLRRLQVK